MSLSDYRIIGPVAYRGKKNCDCMSCARQWLEGEMAPDCIGWHCCYCDEPCSSQGHRCPASEAILGAAEKIAKEDAA